MALVHDIALEHETLITLRSRVLVTGDAAVGKTALVKMLASNGTDYPRNYVMTTGLELVTKAVKVTPAPGDSSGSASAPSSPDKKAASSSSGAGSDSKDGDVAAADSSSTSSSIKSSLQVEFSILDTPGSTIFNQREAGMRLWGLANYCLVCFDIGSKASFASVTKWARRAQDARAASESPALAGKPIQGCLVGCKADFRGGEGASASSSSSARAEVSREDAQSLASSLGLAYFEVSAEQLGGSVRSYEEPFKHLARLVAKAYSSEVSHAKELVMVGGSGSE